MSKRIPPSLAPRKMGSSSCCTITRSALPLAASASSFFSLQHALPVNFSTPPVAQLRQLIECSCFSNVDPERRTKATRRAALVQLAAGTVALSQVLAQNAGSALAVGQNMLAGRIPGLSDPDSEGLRTYRRPDAKSGGHGVGWSPIIPYSFKVPTDWEEVPVSIADLGGTEIDLRFQSPSEGNISVVVAPVLRFSAQLGDNVKIEDVGVPEKVIDAFGPELTGETVEGKVKSMDVRKYDGRTYYQYELEIPHMLISATAAGNRLYLFSAYGNGRQWKKFSSDLKNIRDSFRVG